MRALLLHDAEVEGERVDILLREGVVAAVGGSVELHGPGEVVDCKGGAVIPGLHDHHIHLASLAASLSSVKVGPEHVRNASEMASVLRGAASRLEPGGWLRAVGYHEGVAGDLDREALDSMVGDVPLRVQHRSGAMWILSSAAVEAAGVERASHPGIERDVRDRSTGRVFGADSWLRSRLPEPLPLDLGAVGTLLAGCGVTGVTDMTPSEDADDFQLLQESIKCGALPQRLMVTGGPRLVDTPVPPPLDRGPVKLIVADHRPPEIDELASDIARVHRRGRAVAIHCVTNLATVIALSAWSEARVAPGDRIEHGSVITPESAATIARLGLTVVTQPSLVLERGDDYLRDVEPADVPWLYRCATLRQMSIPVAGGTDAPYADPDPWIAIRVAKDRTTRSGEVVGSEERMSSKDALELFLGAADRPGGPRRRVEVGADADLCVLRVPLACALAAPDSSNVRLTLRRGVAVFGVHRTRHPWTPDREEPAWLS